MSYLHPMVPSKENMQHTQSDLSKAIGRKVKRAASSLTAFAVELDENTGLLFEAVDDSGTTGVTVSLIDAGDLPKLHEAVCSVDWSWITNSTVAEIVPGSPAAKFKLEPTGVITVGSGMWQGKPFLSFQPFRPAR